VNGASDEKCLQANIFNGFYNVTEPITKHIIYISRDKDVHMNFHFSFGGNGSVVNILINLQCVNENEKN
jgi:hypothetical protein